jgi:hypothetical protein
MKYISKESNLAKDGGNLFRLALKTERYSALSDIPIFESWKSFLLPT